MSQNGIYLIRHGETAWSEAGKHTGLMDIPLSDLGKKQSELLAKRLKTFHFSQVFCSPAKRAVETCELCGFHPKLDSDLWEWNYGEYEGLTSEQIHNENPTWQLFKDGAPGGETVVEVVQRAHRFLSHLPNQNVAIFSSSHFLRILTTVWLGLEPKEGMYLYLSTASISTLGFEHQNKVILHWNDVAHIESSEYM